MVKKPLIKGPFDDLITWIGSTQSFILHTIVFLTSFTAVIFDLVPLDTMLLVLTTAVSLEAIYLAIFIQMSVNKNTISLREVEEDIDEIEEELEDLSEEEKAEVLRDKVQTQAIEDLSGEVKRLLEIVETLKKK